MQQSRSGFTLVELLIVIVVILVLATITTVSYTEIRQRAQASAIAADLRATEKALGTLRASTSTDPWWLDTDATLSGSAAGNPTIGTIIAAQPELAKLIRNPPTTAGLGTVNAWFYDNEGDTYNGCSVSTAGVNLIVNSVQNIALVQAVDTLIDDGNLSCGKVRAAISNGGSATFTYGMEG